MADDKKLLYHRTMDAILDDVGIMDNASAVDWRVLHAVERHQGYKTWRCKVSLARIAKVARCSRRTASTSSRWWQEMRVLRITRSGKSNIYEIVRNFRPSPGIVHRQRHISRKQQKRDSRGKYAPSTAHQSSPSTAHQSSPSMAYRDSPSTVNISSENAENMGNPLISFSLNVSEQNPPFPPQGEQPTSEEKSGGHLSPFVGRSGPPQERKDLTERRKTQAKKLLPVPSPEILRQLQKAMGREKLKAYLLDKGYPLTLLPKEEPGARNDTLEHKNDL